MRKPTETHFIAKSSQLVQWGMVVIISTLVSCHKLKGLSHKGWELCCNGFYLFEVILSLIVSLLLKLGTVHSLELCFWETTAAQNGMLGVTLWNKMNVLRHSFSLHCSLTGINTKVYICIKDVGDCWMHDTWMAIIICRELVYYAYNQSDSVHVRSWPAHYGPYHVNPCSGVIKGRNILEQAK